MHSDQPRIYLVDDSRLDRELLAGALDGLGRIQSFEDAEAALSAVLEDPPDVLITDHVMPGMSGTDLLARVRGERPEVEVILVTGVASVEPAIAALRAGASDYIRKPVEPETLRHTVQQALLRKRLIAENERLQEGLRVAESCRVLASCLEPGEVYPLALDLLLEIAGSPRGLAVFRRAAPVQSYGVAFRGFDEEASRRLRQWLVEEKGVDLDALESITALDRGPVVDGMREVGVDVDGLVAVPIRSTGGGGGVLWLMGRDTSRDGLLAGRFDTVREYAELALGNAERYLRAKDRAFVDDVTEIYNARYLHSALENEVQRAARYGNALSVVFLDLDRFKLVNDRHGHLVGSETLRRLAQMLLECVRQVDTLARYGGDEFTVLLADTDHAAAMAVAERVRASVEAYEFDAADGSPLRLTISAGVASFGLHGESSEGLLDAADQAMYRAKSQGRNRVCSAGESDDGGAGAV